MTTPIGSAKQIKKFDRPWIRGQQFEGRSFIVFILDKSGSMSSIKPSVVAGYNEWIELVQREGVDVLYTLTLFDDKMMTPIKNVPIADVLPIDEGRYIANGGTHLYDATALTILETDTQVTDDDRVLVVILTDGIDEYSHQYSMDDVRFMIESYQARGNWTFTYLSSHPNVWETAKQMGILGPNTATFDQNPNSARAAMKAIAESTIAYVQSEDMASVGFYELAGENQELLALGFRAGE